MGGLYIELDSLIFAYDGDTLYRVDKLLSKLEKEDPVAHPGLWIRSTWVNNFVEYGFLSRNQGFRSILTNPDISHKIVDTLIDQWPCKGFHFYLPNEGEFTNQYFFAAIDTIEYMVRKRSSSIWFQENEQF